MVEIDEQIIEVDGQLTARRVTMANALARAAHSLTFSEKRLVCIAISKLDSKKARQPNEIIRTKITAFEFAEAFKVDIDTAYNQLKSASGNLMKRHVEIYRPAFRRGGKPLPDTVVRMQWVGEAAYQVGEGWIELAWWPAIIPHLTGLKKNFTTYLLQQTVGLRTLSSWRLLELLTSFSTNGWLEIPIEDFYKSMEVTEKQQQDFAKVRTKHIEPAIAELHAKDGWKISWKPIKSGRKVVALRFDFKRDDQLRMDV
jgi:plasmid replication initiation protein